jgi:alpha-glucosidase
LSEIGPARFCSTGTLVELNDGAKVYISESDLLDYPGMFLKGNKENPFGLQAKFAGYPLEVNQKNDRSVEVTKHANYLAKTKGTRTFPWRVMVVTENDGQLVESEMIWKLATPSKIDDPSWIKPGKVSWDWWNDNNVYGVDFKSGINTETYKYYIDFAAEYNLEYIILDEGWYHLEDVLKIKKEVNLPELLAYAESKQVGLILWVTWKALYDQLDLALQTFEDWGVKGIKVDFMQRDDQWMVNYYTLVAEKAAAHHLLVDFHGAYKPAGLHRTWPNVLTFEGVAGMEQSKWGTKANPDHDLMLPYIRMVAGPMDYTPGAMKNANQEDFRPIFASPMSQGTRCHQLAMYVVFESPLQMLSDNPSNYLREEETMEFLRQVPTTWENTKVLNAKVSDYILLARKSQEKWFVGAMTDWEERYMNISFDFLEEGEYSLQVWQDGVNANKHAADYQVKSLTIDKNTILPIHLAKGGGWVGILSQTNTKD